MKLAELPDVFQHAVEPTQGIDVVPTQSNGPAGLGPRVIRSELLPAWS
jgi:hypothetical protein